MKIHGLVLAAGMSKRMQQFKPLMKIGDKTMIETTVDQMLDAGVKRVTVVLGYRAEEVKRVLTLDRQRAKKIQFAYNIQYETTEMLDSIKVGLREMESCDYFFVAPGDMPAISEGTYQTLCGYAGKTQKRVVFPVLEGRRKHPPMIAWECREDILNFEGMGLRELWKQYEGAILEVPLNDRGCTMDVDYQADYRKVCIYIKAREADQMREALGFL